MYADRLHYGDEIRVIAPSKSLGAVRPDLYDKALNFLKSQGFSVTFSKNSWEMDETESSHILSRVDDIHEVFLDTHVKAVLTCIGGFNVNQILEYLDYTLIQNNPKILCGYSDITALLNAVYSKTGLVTYHGPHFSTFAFEKNREYTTEFFNRCLMSSASYAIFPSPEAKEYVTIQEGCAEGIVIGGNLCTLNLLQGTPFMPDLKDKILFIEDDNIMGNYFSYEFDRNLQSLLQQKNADTIKGLVFGRFDDSCGLTPDIISRMVGTKKQLKGIPVLFNVDFGHVFPLSTFPIGGTASIVAEKNKAEITITKH